MSLNNDTILRDPNGRFASDGMHPEPTGTLTRPEPADAVAASRSNDARVAEMATASRIFREAAEPDGDHHPSVAMFRSILMSRGVDSSVITPRMESEADEEGEAAMYEHVESLESHSGVAQLEDSDTLSRVVYRQLGPLMASVQSGLYESEYAAEH